MTEKMKAGQAMDVKVSEIVMGIPGTVGELTYDENELPSVFPPPYSTDAEWAERVVARVTEQNKAEAFTAAVVRIIDPEAKPAKFEALAMAMNASPFQICLAALEVFS